MRLKSFKQHKHIKNFGNIYFKKDHILKSVIDSDPYVMGRVMDVCYRLTNKFDTPLSYNGPVMRKGYKLTCIPIEVFYINQPEITLNIFRAMLKDVNVYDNEEIITLWKAKVEDLRIEAETMKYNI